MRKTTRAATAVDAYIGARVRFRRLEVKVTQALLADRIGVSPQQCQKMETGENRISAAALLRIALALETPVEYFYTGASVGQVHG